MQYQSHRIEDIMVLRALIPAQCNVLFQRVSTIDSANRKTDTTVDRIHCDTVLSCDVEVENNCVFLCAVVYNCLIRRNTTMKLKGKLHLAHFSVGMFLTVILSAEAQGQKSSCGGILKDARNAIRSPNYPNKYPANSDCSWTISAPAGHKINLNFREFLLERSDPCNDWLDIYDGSSIRETKLGRYCGSNKPSTVQSTGHHLHLKFSSDGASQRRGFKAWYNTTRVCGGTYSGRTGTIKSPNYPYKSYYPSTDCLYKITVQSGSRVKVKFQDFVLEPASDDGSCYDYVEAFDGTSIRNRSLGKFCGTLRPFTIFSTRNAILLRLATDKTTNGRGFKLQYTTIASPGDQVSQTVAPISAVLPPTSLPSTSFTSCLSNTFKCKNGKCIEKRWRCDRQDDCGDWSDEQNCPCHSYELTCANGACVGLIRACDGSDDCGDGTDELNCDKPSILSGTINCAVNNGGCQHNCTEFIARGRKISECTCLSGFRLLYDGKSCGDVDECRANNGGCHQICLNTPGSHQCACKRGYRLTASKITCEDINECSFSNGGCNHDCINDLGGYHCRCYPGFEHADSNRKKCRDINECKSANGGCSHSCVNSAGSFYCQCPAGYQLDSDDKTCVDINECAINKGGCQHECQNTLGSFLCVCHDGYINDYVNPSRCMDINECAVGMPACFHCINTPGSYECRCDDPGFILNEDKTMCVDIDECATNNGGCGQHKCINNYGSYKCQCLPGYKLDPRTSQCEDIDECATNDRTGPCDQICTNTAGSFLCSCRDGYKLRQQTRCLDIDECAINAHRCEHRCNNTIGSYTCSCRKGFFLSIDGFSCGKSMDSRECGIAPLARLPTASGWEATERAVWPWAALIHFNLFGDSDGLFGDVEGCMGSLIDKEWVLTAAHCVHIGPIPLTPSIVKVELGAFTRASSSHTPVLHGVAEIILHKDFDMNHGNLASNIALIRLAKAVKITDDIRPICMPTRQEVDHLLKPGVSRTGVLIGWGTRIDHRIQDTLQQAKVSVVHRSKCAWHKTKYDANNMICAGFTKPRVTPCISDTGSPLMFPIGGNIPNARKWVLGGITSWGLRSFDTGCHDNYRYTAYTSVRRYLKWIKFRGNLNKGNIK